MTASGLAPMRLRPAGRPRRLAALIANLDSSPLAVRCVESLQREWVDLGFSARDLEIVVVDRALGDDFRPHLAELAARGARSVSSAGSAGPAAGINVAVAHTSGAREDCIALLSPDVEFLPGSVGTLLDHLDAHPSCGAIAPRAFLDLSRTLAHAPIRAPSPVELLRSELFARFPAFSRRLDRTRLRSRIRWWSAATPITVEMLSGACMFLRRAAIDGAGRLMDERFSACFEDADLCRRLRKRGFELVLDSRAAVVRTWSSPAVRASHLGGDSRARHRASRRAFVARHHGRLGAAFERATQVVFDVWPRSKHVCGWHEQVDLGVRDRPFTFELSRPARFLIEIGSSPSFFDAAGVHGDGQHFEWGSSAWSALGEGRHFALAFDRDTLEELGAWTFVKPTAARTIADSRAFDAERARTA